MSKFKIFNYSIFILVGFALLTAYQNCAPTKFTPHGQEILNKDLRTELIRSDEVPKCSHERPSDFENAACLAPYSATINAVVRFTISCTDQGQWQRQQNGPIDYSLCPRSCDEALKPENTGIVACQSPYENILSGIQRYLISCDSSYNWVKTPNGVVDYSNCPKSCDMQSRPSEFEMVKCPQTNDILSRQNYQISCATNGQWVRTPSTVDSSGCPSPTCDNSTKPSSSQIVACPEPYQNEIRSIETYQVTCSGQTWVKTLINKDNTACSKSCSGVAPTDQIEKLACQSPYQSELLAEQKYVYVCDKASGQYNRIKEGPVNYSSCPSCSPGYKFNSVTRQCEIEKIACTFNRGCSSLGVGYKCVYLCNRYKGEMCQTFMGGPSVRCMKPETDGQFNIYSWTSNYTRINVSLPYHSELMTSGGSYAITDASLADENLCGTVVSLDPSKTLINPYYPNLDTEVRLWYPKSKFTDVTEYENSIQQNIDRWNATKKASNCNMN